MRRNEIKARRNKIQIRRNENKIEFCAGPKAFQWVNAESGFARRVWSESVASFPIRAFRFDWRIARLIKDSLYSDFGKDISSQSDSPAPARTCRAPTLPAGLPAPSMVHAKLIARMN
jgi:hypothetical protein